MQKLIYYPAPATGLLNLTKMEEIKFKINIYYEIAKYVEVPDCKKLDIIFNLLNLKNRGIINNAPLLTFSDNTLIPIDLLKDKVHTINTDPDIFLLSAKFKMMHRYKMISADDMEILSDYTIARLKRIYQKMDCETGNKILISNFPHLCLN